MDYNDRVRILPTSRTSRHNLVNECGTVVAIYPEKQVKVLLDRYSKPDMSKAERFARAHWFAYNEVVKIEKQVRTSSETDLPGKSLQPFTYPTKESTHPLSAYTDAEIVDEARRRGLITGDDRCGTSDS